MINTVVTLLLKRWYKCIVIILLFTVSFSMTHSNNNNNKITNTVMAFGGGVIRRISGTTSSKSSLRILSLSTSSSVTTRVIPKISRLQSSQRHLFGVFSSSSSNRIIIPGWYSLFDRRKCNTIQQFTTTNGYVRVSQCYFFRLYSTSSCSTGTTGSSNVPLPAQDKNEPPNSILVPPTTTESSSPSSSVLTSILSSTLSTSTTTPSTTTTTTPSARRGYENYIDIELPEGRCIGLKLLDLPAGHPDELTKEAILRYSNHGLTNIGFDANDSVLTSGSTGSTENTDTINNYEPTTNHNNKLHWIYDKLHIDEINYGLLKVKDDSSIKNQKCFWLGRLAMREGLQLITSSSASESESSAQLNNHQQSNDETATVTSTPLSSKDTTCIQNISILKDEHGRPQVPNGFIGSISHKEMIGVALISSSLLSSPTDIFHDNKLNNSIIRRTVGIDIEKRQSTRKSIGRKVLTPYEMSDLGQIPGMSIDEEVLLRFSLKECVYKSIHPLLNQYISFQEAEIKPLPNGTADIKLFLKSNAHTKLHTVSAHWLCYNTEYFLCSSSASTIE